MKSFFRVFTAALVSLSVLAFISDSVAQSPRSPRAQTSVPNATVLAPVPAKAPIATAGPKSQLFLTDGDGNMNWVVQGTRVVNSWTQHNGSEEYALGVLTTMRTIGDSTLGLGSEYTLSGVYTGTNYTAPAAGNFYDGASDGNLIYSVDYTDGGVYSFNSDWTGQTLLFSTPSEYLDIAYDFSNGTLWLASFAGSTVENRSLSGTILSSFTVPFTEITCLAMDPADGTLWMGTQTNEGTFYQYSRTGKRLGSVTYPELVSANTLGGEFSTTVPHQGQVTATNATITAPSGDTATFSIDVNYLNNKDIPTGHFTYVDPAAHLDLESFAITYLVINGKTAGISGSVKEANNKNKRFSFTIHVSDNGPGPTDTFTITLTNGYTASGTLTSGNIVVQ